MTSLLTTHYCNHITSSSYAVHAKQDPNHPLSGLETKGTFLIILHHQEYLIAHVELNWGVEGWWEIGEWVTTKLLCLQWKQQHIQHCCRGLEVAGARVVCVCVCYVWQRTELKWSSAQFSKTKQVLPELLQPKKKIKTMEGFQRASLDQQTHNPLSPHYSIFKAQTTVLRNNKNFTPPITSHTFPESTKQEIQWYMITQDDMYITISVNKEENVLQKAGIKHYYSYYYTEAAAGPKRHKNFSSVTTTIAIKRTVWNFGKHLFSFMLRVWWEDQYQSEC